ncbi:MAG: cellulose synthase/poly-beta-1,6-N-acetylglucosamine synthase-like glycosyltransferase [Roseivirga sp.]|jgi:cellulose synthase/poly-beta-1,6-N-acetylglucosamine synthase-like glycosyltransferase
MNTLINILLFIAIAYLSLAGLYMLILAVASKIKRASAKSLSDKINKFLVLVPSYKEDQVIIASAKRNLALKYQYPKADFDFVVIADGLMPKTIASLKQMGVIVHTVAFEKSTKVKSLQSTMSHFDKNDNYNAVVILDADNVMNLNFLHKANAYLNQGYKVIQGQRAAANAQNTIALLDGLSELANQQMICKGANVLGLSSKLSGSSMVFDFDLFNEVVFDLTAIGGFDKELELAFTKERVFIKYADDLIVSDEKVGSFESFSKQRGRWLESQYSFLRKSWKSAVSALFQGNFDYFHKTLQLAMPPKVMAPFALMLLVIISLLIGNYTLTIIALSGLIANLSAYFITLPFDLIWSNGLQLIKAIPKLLISTIGAFKWMKKSKTEFIHTRHHITKV